MSADDAVSLRICAPGDADALALVGQATFLETFAGDIDAADILDHCVHQNAPRVYRDWLSQPASSIWIAEANPGKAPVGYLVLAAATLPISDPRADDLEIKRIYLLHRFHGSGIGKRLLVQALDHASALACSRVLLGVYSGNANAIAFYERNGFKPVGHRQFTVGRNDFHDFVYALELQR